MIELQWRERGVINNVWRLLVRLLSSRCQGELDPSMLRMARPFLCLKGMLGRPPTDWLRVSVCRVKPQSLNPKPPTKAIPIQSVQPVQRRMEPSMRPKNIQTLDEPYRRAYEALYPKYLNPKPTISTLIKLGRSRASPCWLRLLRERNPAI